MAFNSHSFANNPFESVYPNRATIGANNRRIETTVFSNSNSNSHYLPSVPNQSNQSIASTITPMVSNSYRSKTTPIAASVGSDCGCDPEFVDFCKMHSISHSGCVSSKQVRCELCSTTTDHKSIQWHIGSEKHRQRHKQLMEYVFLLSLPLYSKSQAFRIQQLLEANHKKCALTPIDVEKRLRVVEDINELMQRNDLKSYSVRLYGSTINGFGLKESDINLDIQCNHTNESENVDKSEKTEKPEKSVNSVAIILSKISDIIEKNNKLFSHLRNEYNLKVPKVRFKDRKNGFEIELSITVEKSWRSSRLLQQYCQIDDRVGVLGCALREWARMYGFDDQENGLWPAFTFPILVIHFLQRCSPPVLPCLHELFPSTPVVPSTTPEVQNQSSVKAHPNEDNDTVDQDFNLSSLNWTKSNHKSVGELWLELLRYYAVEFDAETYVVSIRNSRVIPTRTDKNWSTRMMAVEDPTRPSLNLSRSVGSMRLYNVFVEQMRHTFKYFAIPFFNIMPNNAYPNPRASPLYTERDFEVLVNQNQYYNSFNVNELMAQISYVNNELDNDSDSDSEEENRKKENFHLKATRILKTFGIRMKLSAELENTLQLIPTNQLVYSFQIYKLPFFQRPPKFCRLCHRYSHQQIRCPDNQLPPLRPLPDILDVRYNDLLVQICFQIFNEKRMDENDEQIQTYILADLERFIRQQMPNAKLELFGSTKNGFGARNCDLDICLTFEDNQTGEGLEFEKIIESVGKILQTHQNLTNITPIVSAKVPIVKFGYILERNQCVECDISLYNILARYNTLWLRRYTQIDPRVKVLGFVVKHFAKTCDMGDASRGSLSSYAYSLMTIHFLQQKGIIPVLQEIGLDRKVERVVDGWDTWFFDDLKTLDMYWRAAPNQESVGQLFIGFLRYYSEAFNFDEHVVCCRQLAPLKRLEKMWTGSRIAIEDPFLLSHNLGAGVSPQMAVFIKTSFVLGRNLFGMPPQKGLDPRFRSWSDYFFDRHMLTHGLPPTGRGCRNCGKIGHKQNQCPERRDRHVRHDRQDRADRPNRADRPEQSRDKKLNQNRRKPLK